MKIAGIILFLIGGLILLVGIVVCVVTLTDDYASSACAKAARDREAIARARANCSPTIPDCFRNATVGLTTQEECDSRRSFMNRQLLMGIVPGVLGGLLAFVGLLLTVFGFVRARKKRTMVPG